MTPERLAGLRTFGPFASLQVVPSRPTDDELIDLLSNPAQGVVPGGPVAALTYHGGPVVKTPRLVAIYAGTFWGDRAKNDQFLKDVMACGYLSALSSGFTSGAFLGSFAVPLLVNHVDDGYCRTLISSALATVPGIPQPDPATIYMLILPNGVSVGDGTPGNSNCTAFCGYHSSTSNFLYTVQPSTDCPTCNQGNPFDALTMVESHEIAETCNDPYGSGWYNDQTGMENGDECAWVRIAWGPWTVQGYAAPDASGAWINAIGSYTPVAAPQPNPGPPPGPPPKPAFVPDPAAVAWLHWELAVAQYLVDEYAAGNVSAVVQEQSLLATDAATLATYLAGLAPAATATARSLPPRPDALPSAA